MKDLKFTDETIEDLASLLKIFGDATRIRILLCLSKSDSYVGELAEQLGMTQSAVSHQLSVLKQSKLVKTQRQGKNILYAIADDHVSSIIETGLEHVMED